MADRGSRLVIGGGAQAAVRLGGLLSAAITMPLIARHLGPGRYGQLAIILAVVALVATAADLGLPLLVSRDWPALAPVRRRAWLAAFWSARWWSGTLVWVAASTVALSLPLAPVVRLGLVVGLVSLPMSVFSNSLAAFYNADLTPTPPAISEAVTRVLWIVGLLVAVAHDGGVIALVVVQLAAQAAGLAVVVWLGRGRTWLVAPALECGGARAVLARAAPLAVLPLLGIVYFRSDTLVLAATVSDAEVGVYGALWRIIEILLSVMGIAAGLLVPLLTGAGGLGEQRDYYRRAQRLMAMVMLPVAAAIAVAAGPILRLLGGREFFQPVDTAWGVVRPEAALTVLMVAFALMSLGLVNGAVMIARHRQAKLIRHFVIVVTVNLVLTIWLVRSWSYMGAAVASLVSEAVGTVHSTAVVRRELGPLDLARTLAWPGAAAATVALSMAVVPGPAAAVLGVGVVVGTALLAVSPAGADLRAQLKARPSGTDVESGTAGDDGGPPVGAAALRTGTESR